MKKVFEIEGMSCAGCVRTVEKSVKKIKGTSNVIVDLESKRLSVDFDKDLTKKVIKEVSKAGYKAIVSNK